MNSESEKEKEIEEIRRGLEYLKNTNQISVSEKISITRKALEIVEKSKTEVKEGVQCLRRKKRQS